MRRMTLALCASTLGAFFISPALAESDAVVAPTALLRGPGGKQRGIATLETGAQVEIIHFGRHWSRVSHKGWRGYVATAQLASAAAGRPPINPASDPSCDYGYPYSGSGAYFTGLTALRTSEPLGALFGYHRRWPC